MSVETAMAVEMKATAAITTKTSTRIYVSLARQGATLPRIVLHLVSAQHTHHLNGGSGLAEGTIAVECFDDNAIDATDLGNDVRTAFDNFVGDMGSGGNLVACKSCHLGSESSAYVEPTDGSEVGTHVFRQFWSVWYSETKPAPT